MDIKLALIIAGVFFVGVLIGKLRAYNSDTVGTIFFNIEESGKVEGMYVEFARNETDILHRQNIFLRVRKVKARN